MDCYVLPGMVQCFMDPGRVPATNGAKAKLRTKLEDLEAERVKKAQAAEDELAKKETRQPNQISKRPVTDKEIERDLDKEELGPGRWHNWKDLKIGLTTLGKIEISDPKSYIPEVIGDPDDDSFMKSYVGRLYQQGFYVHGYFISDFNPEKAVLKLIDEYTQKQLLRRNNLVTIRQDIDTAHGERSVREIHTVGSAKSISQLLGQIADDVLERFGIDWVPGPEMIASLILPMEKYRTIRMSKNTTYIVDMDKHIPGFSDMITAAAVARGPQTPPQAKSEPKPGEKPGQKPPADRRPQSPATPTRTKKS